MIRLRARLRGVPEASERGFTLVELLVAIFVLAILLTMVTVFFASTLKIITTTQGTQQATANASTTINTVARVVRSSSEVTITGGTTPSPAFIAGTSESATFYSYTDAYVSSSSTQVQPSIVQFSLNASRQLVEKRWLPTATSGDIFTFPALTATPTYNHIIGGPLLATPAAPPASAPASTYLDSAYAPLFTYLDATGLAITPSGTGLTCAQQQSVASVLVTVRVNGATSSVHPAVVLQNTVGLPNLGAAGDSTC
jgi:prepilin-type N-terminal cleavage/methylation domain-containing protein